MRLADARGTQAHDGSLLVKELTPKEVQNPLLVQRRDRRKVEIGQLLLCRVLPASVYESYGVDRVCFAAHSNRGEYPWLKYVTGPCLLSSGLPAAAYSLVAQAGGWRSVSNRIGNGLADPVGFQTGFGARQSHWPKRTG